MKKFFYLSLTLLSVIALSATAYAVDFTLADISAASISTASVSLASAALVGDRDRNIFNALRGKYPSLMPAPSYLRVETTLQNSRSNYLFDVKKNGNESATEVKLDRNDLFVITDLAFYIIAQDSTKVGREILETYNNETSFPAVVGPPAFDPKDLEAVYNGKFSLKLGTIVNIEGMSMQHFKHVPQTQRSAATNRNQYSQRDASYALGSLIYLRGTNDITVSVDIPTYAGIALQAQAANVNHKLVFHPYGYLIKGGGLVEEAKASIKRG